MVLRFNICQKEMFETEVRLIIVIDFIQRNFITVNAVLALIHIVALRHCDDFQKDQSLHWVNKNNVKFSTQKKYSTHQIRYTADLSGLILLQVYQFCIFF